MTPKGRGSKRTTQARRRLDLPTWLAGQIESAGITQLQIAEHAKVNPNDLSRWKNGQAAPEMDNLLRLAHYFDEDPEKLFEMAGKPELIEVYRFFLPKYQKRQLSEEDLYKNPKHAKVHRKIQKLLVLEGYEAMDSFRIGPQEAILVLRR